MRDLLSDYERMVAAGQPVGRGVVTSVWGSAPRGPGACLLATPDGTIAGSVSGGCVEGATATEIADAIGRGTPKLIEFGVSNETAWEVGLACGGTIRVFVEPTVRPEVLEAAAGPRAAVLVTAIDGPDIGWSMLVWEDGSTNGPFPPPRSPVRPEDSALARASDRVREVALDALQREASRTETLSLGETPATVFFEVHPRSPRLVIYGGVHIAIPLVTLARELGFRTIVADGREAFISGGRFAHADEVIHAWPDEAFEKIGLDPATYVCVMTHDPKFDDPALEIALKSSARYVGAIGSRKTQTTRRDRLLAAGVTGEQLARLHGPIGLDLGGRQPAETALAIMAEIVAARYRERE